MYFTVCPGYAFVLVHIKSAQEGEREDVPSNYRKSRFLILACPKIEPFRVLPCLQNPDEANLEPLRVMNHFKAWNHYVRFPVVRELKRLLENADKGLKKTIC